MLFTSYSFIGFISVVFILYYVLPKKCQWPLLLMASYIFYFIASPSYLIFIAATTVSTYLVSRKLESIKTEQDAYIKANKGNITKDEKKNTVPINNVPESADAADLQTVFAELIHNFNQTRRCAMQREVYDGKKHYRVIIRDEGTENRYFDWLKRTENSYKCSFYIENLKENNDNILWDVSADRPIYLWVGVDAKKGVPYVAEIRIEATPLGALTVTPRSFATTEGKLKKSEKDKENG